MKIPSGLIERQLLYTEVSNACLASRANRVDDYVRREAFYLFGAESGNPPAEFNRIHSSIKNLKAFVYAADSTTFTIELGVEVQKIEIARIVPVSRYLNQTWSSSNSDETASQCVEWALVYNTMMMKSLWTEGAFRTYCVRPHDFGVYNEAVNNLDDQEAMVHCYEIPLEELKRRIKFLRNADKILKDVSPKKGAPYDANDGVSRLIMTASSPVTIGNVPNSAASISGSLYNALTQPDYNPHNDIPMVEMRELWIWNDDKEDYQVVTMSGTTPLVDREAGEINQGRMFYPKAENPFTKFTPSPKFNYFWGLSDVELVIRLQAKRQSCMDSFDNLLDKNVKPPTSGFGYTEEAMVALMSIGGMAMGTDPAASVQQHVPEIPDELLRRIDMIDEGFDSALALSNVLQGKGEAGVRGRGHAQELARISSARIKEKALSVEDSLEKAATLQLKLQALYDETHLPSDDGHSFTLAQLAPECVVKVDAHSNSPLFADEARELANEMFDKEVIDGKSYIELLKAPNQEVLKQRYDKLKEEKQREMLMQAAQSGSSTAQ